MANLRDTVAAILADLTRAQDSANVLSRTLSQKYLTDKTMHSFNVPNAVISGVELALNFAVLPPGGTTETVGPPAPPIRPPLGRFLQLGHQLAEHVLHATHQGLPHAAPGAAPLVERLGRGLRHPGAADELGDQIGFALQRWYGQLDAAAQTRPVQQLSGEALNVVGGVVRAAVLGDDAVSAMADTAPLAAHVETGSGPQLRALVEAFLARLRSVDLDSHALPQMDVCLDSEILGKLPPQALQTLKLQLQIDDYRWMVMEKGREEELVEQE